MNGNLPPPIARVTAARLGIHKLARPGVKKILASRDPGRDELSLEPQVRQLPNGMRQQVQADPERRQLRGPLGEPRGGAVAVKGESGRRPADSRANDDNIVLVGT